MPDKRLDREEFFERLDALDEEHLKKVLWNLYWRGSAPIRERIESELDPDPSRQRTRAKPEPVDPKCVRHDVGEFVELARSGAYLAGDRRVRPRERTRWRFTFRRLVKEVEAALREEELEDGAAAMEMLIDLAQKMRGYDYFRSEDPIEAAGVVISDEVALLWSQMRSALSLAEFARYAAPQLIRWESKFGWTRTGFGRVSEKEETLANVVARLLTAPDMWIGFADAYLEALEALAPDSAVKGRERPSLDRSREHRTSNLADWHHMLIVQLMGSEAEDRLDRLAQHQALRGPDLVFFRAQLARERGDLESARRLTTEALERLPGHRGYLQFAEEISAQLPARAITRSSS